MEELKLSLCCPGEEKSGFKQNSSIAWEQSNGNRSRNRSIRLSKTTVTYVNIVLPFHSIERLRRKGNGICWSSDGRCLQPRRVCDGRSSSSGGELPNFMICSRLHVMAPNFIIGLVAVSFLTSG